MACEFLACISENGCVDAVPDGLPGQIMALNVLGVPAWADMETAVPVSASAINNLSYLVDGLFVPKIFIFGGSVDTLQPPLVGPFAAGTYIVDTDSFTVTNATTRTQYFHVVSHGSMRILLPGGVPTGFDLHHTMIVDGIQKMSTQFSSDGATIATEGAMTGSASDQFDLGPGDSILVEIRHILVVSVGTVDEVRESRMGHSYISFLMVP